MWIKLEHFNRCPDIIKHFGWYSSSLHVFLYIVLVGFDVPGFALLILHLQSKSMSSWDEATAVQVID